MNELHTRAFGIDQIETAGSRKNATKTRGRPFAKGNPGRPKGARGRTTLAAQMLLDGEAELITRKCIDLALEGDPTALKLCMERLVPPRKELPIEFTMPPLRSGADITAVMVAIIQAVSEGKILLGQALDLAKLLLLYGQTAGASDPEDLSTLTDEELRARISQKLAKIGNIKWHEDAEAAGGPTNVQKIRSTIVDPHYLRERGSLQEVDINSREERETDGAAD